MKCNECGEEYAEDVYLYCPYCDTTEMLDDGDMPEYTDPYDETGHVKVVDNE
jgi:hypothetical protein